MTQAAQPAAPAAAATPGDPSAHFLAELENAWALLRLYGPDHPNFLRSADAVVASLVRPVKVSINPNGFLYGTTPATGDRLIEMAKRLRAMGLVGLNVETGLTAAQVTALLLALDAADRGQARGEPVVNELAAATDQRVKAVLLKLGGLRLVEGTARDPAAPASPDLSDDPAAIWHGLFAGAFGGGAGPAGPTVEGIAKSFEAAISGVESADRWNAVAGAWIRELAALPLGGGESGGAASTGGGAGEGSGNGTPPNQMGGPAAEPRGSAAGVPTHPTGPGGQPTGAAAPADRKDADRLDTIASFLQALSPMLCRRLLARTVSDAAVPERVVLALAARLPSTVILGALSAVDRTGLEPSAAALALLRKVSANVATDGHAPDSDVTDPSHAPGTNAELAEVAGSLERLLGATREADFVPAEYLRRREELSRNAVAPDGSDAGAAVAACPTDRETARHAAEIALQILATPDASPGQLAFGFEFLRQRIDTWARSGEFAFVSRAVALADALGRHTDESVSEPARSVLAAGVSADDLAEGARHAPDRAAAVEGIAGVLRQADGALLAGVLCSAGATKGAQDGVVLEAARRVLPGASDGFLRRLVEAAKDKPTPALLATLAGLPEADAMKAVEAIVAHAGPAARYAVVEAVFRRGYHWPPALTERLLEDSEPGVRRLAVMRVVRDSGPAVAAGFLREATLANRFKTDVAIGLAELLYPHRHHPDVRPVYRRWSWSGRRWVALLSLSFSSGGDGRRAA